jgi:hypothetical protein
MFKRWRSLFRALTRRREFEEGMTEELRFHIEQYTDELVRSGVTPEKAARLAHRELGSLTNIKGDCREAFGIHGHRSSDTRRLFRREFNHFCCDRLGAAPSAAISRARPPGDHI